MTHEEYLLTVLMEECSEVTQRASKVIRFGTSGKEDGQMLTNARRLQIEIADLFAIIEMLEDAINLPPPRRTEIDAKKNKVSLMLKDNK